MSPDLRHRSKFYRHKHAISNIVATILIFMVMIVSLGYLYTLITPTLLGYEAKTNSTNQRFVMENIMSSIEDLYSSPEGTQSRIHIVSNGAVYNMSTGHALYINVTDSSGALIDASAEFSANVGDFNAIVNGSFQYESGTEYFTRHIFENVLLQNDTREINSNFISKANYEYSQAEYILIPLSYIDIISTGTNQYTVTFMVLQFTFSVYLGSMVDFPKNIDEWTLRLSRQGSIVTTVTAINVPGPFSIYHAIDGDSSNTPVYTFGSGGNHDITLRFVTVPILFS